MNVFTVACFHLCVQSCHCMPRGTETSRSAGSRRDLTPAPRLVQQKTPTLGPSQGSRRGRVQLNLYTAKHRTPQEVTNGFFRGQDLNRSFGDRQENVGNSRPSAIKRGSKPKGTPAVAFGQHRRRARVRVMRRYRSSVSSTDRREVEELNRRPSHSPGRFSVEARTGTENTRLALVWHIMHKISFV